MFVRSIFAIILTFLLAATAQAEVKPGAFTLSPMAGGHIFEGDQGLEDSSFWFIGLGYNLTEKAALEAVYTHTDADGDSATDNDAKVRTYRLDALYHFTPEKPLVPYMAVGLGEIYSKYDDGERDHHLLGNIGGGIKYFLNDTFALRADVRYLLDFPDPKNNLQYAAGLVFQFGGGAAAPAPVVMEQPVPVPVYSDGDGDGVTDDLDKCPATPKGAPVDKFGCPLDSDGDGVADYMDKCPATPKRAPVDKFGCPLDSDGDGVADYMDKCPATPKRAPVDKFGCPLDSDGDGVADYLDKCPNTPKGVSIDMDGCPTKLSLKINFDFNSNKVGPEFDDEIAKAAQCINDYPGNLVHIEGHTDSRGPAEYNQKLSERRATAVKDRLVEKYNIPGTRLKARGFGESAPIADNKTKEGRLQNRRVDVACGATE